MATPILRRRPVPEHGPWPQTIPAVLQRILAARGVRNGEQAVNQLANLLPPAELGDLDAAVRLLSAAIAGDRHIVVVGDFDCDGATGTAVAVRGLRLLGAQRVSYCVPNRATHGYGLSVALVQDLAPMLPDLVVTVDSGIACLAGVAAAKASGWQVLVTDHHLPGAQLPAADAIVNPNLRDAAFASKALAGVGVVFYLLLALRAHLRGLGAPAAEAADLATLLDLVAVGTVADLVPLDDNNRRLVAAGLRRLREGRGCSAGLRALIAVSGRNARQLCGSDIGFGIAPRLNAAGRLEDMAVGIECLLTDDASRARELALLLDGINSERKDVQQQMLDQAETLLAGLSESVGAGDSGVVLQDMGWHPGVVGLVASRMKDRLHRPVIALAPAEPGSEQWRGSARSIPGFHVRDALAAVDALHPGVIERFGGHAMAAGLSLRQEQLPAFAGAFEAISRDLLTSELLSAELWSDGELGESGFSRELAEDIRLGGPWGQGFPEPVFDEVFRVLEWRVLAERHLKYVLASEGTGERVSAIHFGAWTGVAPASRQHLAFQLECDDWRGKRDVQLLIRHSWAVDPETQG